MDWIKENEKLKQELTTVREEKNSIQRELAWHTKRKDAQNELLLVDKDVEWYNFVCFSISSVLFCLFSWDSMPVP